MDDKGFKGTYKPPSIIAEKKARRQLLANGHTNPFNLTHHEVRKLAEIETNEILNPVYCIMQGDSFLHSASLNLLGPFLAATAMELAVQVRVPGSGNVSLLRRRRLRTCRVLESASNTSPSGVFLRRLASHLKSLTLQNSKWLLNLIRVLASSRSQKSEILGGSKGKVKP